MFLFFLQFGRRENFSVWSTDVSRNRQNVRGFVKGKENAQTMGQFAPFIAMELRSKLKKRKSWKGDYLHNERNLLNWLNIWVIGNKKKLFSKGYAAPVCINIVQPPKIWKRLVKSTIGGKRLKFVWKWHQHSSYFSNSFNLLRCTTHAEKNLLVLTSFNDRTLKKCE